jgi:hypothetical protein
VETVEGRGRLIHLAPAVLDLLDIPYTGASTDAQFFTSNKLAAKKLLRGAGLGDADIARIFELLGLHTLDQIAAKVGEARAALAELRELFALAGQFVAEYVQKKGIQNPVVVEMKGLLGTKPQEERHNGARRYIDPIPNVKVIEDVANWIQNEALKRMETILQANPHIDVVYAHNDPMAVGCYWAAKNAGRDQEMIFVGVDGLGGPDGGIKRVLEGTLACTFYYPTCAAEGLEKAVKLAHGEQVPKELILDPARITKDNAQEWYDKVTVQ